MNMLKEIREQPEHIREIFMWLSVLIVFSLVGFVWAKSFQERIVVLLNPETTPEVAEEESFASSVAPFGVIKNSVASMRDGVANLSALFGFLQKTPNAEEIDSAFRKSQEITEPRLLPLTENK